jgi:hypothetical protein
MAHTVLETIRFDGKQHTSVHQRAATLQLQHNKLEFNYKELGLAHEEIDWQQFTWRIDLRHDVKQWLSEHIMTGYSYTRMANGRFNDVMYSDAFTLIFTDVSAAVLFKLTYHSSEQVDDSLTQKQWVQALHRTIKHMRAQHADAN